MNWYPLTLQTNDNLPQRRIYSNPDFRAKGMMHFIEKMAIDRGPMAMMGPTISEELVLDFYRTFVGLGSVDTIQKFGLIFFTLLHIQTQCSTQKVYFPCFCAQSQDEALHT